MVNEIEIGGTVLCRFSYDDELPETVQKSDVKVLGVHVSNGQAVTYLCEVCEERDLYTIAIPLTNEDGVALRSTKSALIGRGYTTLEEFAKQNGF